MSPNYAICNAVSVKRHVNIRVCESDGDGDSNATRDVSNNDLHPKCTEVIAARYLVYLFHSNA